MASNPIRTALFLLLASLSTARAQDSLKTIDNPQGGQLVYGAVPNQSTPQGAMAAVLRYTHTRLGSRPQIGTIFQSSDHQTFGAYFTLTSTTQGNQPMAGLVLVSMSIADHPSAAVLYDQASRFPKTEPAMMHTLSDAWRAPAASSSGASSTGHQAPPKPLHMQSGGDGSAHIGLPDDWHILRVSGGQLTAQGPHGEMVGLGLMYQQIHDPHLRSNLQQFSNPNAPGALAYPYGGDIFQAYISVFNQIRRGNHLPPGTFNLISSKPVPPMGPGEQAIEAHFDVDLNDGKGPRTATARIGENYMQNSPTWMMDVQTSSIPKPFVDAEQQTVLAIIHSFNQDVAVINSELQTSLANTRAIGARSAQQAADADSRRIASAAAFQSHMDDIDRASKSMQNYTLDRTELQDNTLNARGAIDNNVAAALIRANPGRYQEVPSTSFLKGVDF